MTRIALCSTVPQVCAEKFVTTPISEKTTAGAGPVGHIMGPARATLFQVGGQNFSKLEVVLKPCLGKIEISIYFRPTFKNDDPMGNPLCGQEVKYYHSK